MFLSKNEGEFFRDLLIVVIEKTFIFSLTLEQLRKHQVAVLDIDDIFFGPDLSLNLSFLHSYR
jgi:hypothetical protein